MKEKPIIFSSEMVRAILEGRKSQTRRVIKFELNQLHTNYHGIPLPKCNIKLLGDWPLSNIIELKNGILKYEVQSDVDDSYTREIRCPYGVVGDLLWVREAWCCGTHMWQLTKTPKELGCDMWIAWKENYNDDAPALKQLAWRPSIHMPKWAARLWLKITNIRVERVQEISIDDVQAEGCTGSPLGKQADAILFSKLWDSINAKRGYPWKDNPWVWVIEFSRC